MLLEPWRSVVGVEEEDGCLLRPFARVGGRDRLKALRDCLSSGAGAIVSYDPAELVEGSVAGGLRSLSLLTLLPASSGPLMYILARAGRTKSSASRRLGNF